MTDEVRTEPGSLTVTLSSIMVVTLTEEWVDHHNQNCTGPMERASRVGWIND